MSQADESLTGTPVRERERSLGWEWTSERRRSQSIEKVTDKSFEAVDQSVVGLSQSELVSQVPETVFEEKKDSVVSTQTSPIGVEDLKGRSPKKVKSGGEEFDKVNRRISYDDINHADLQEDNSLLGKQISYKAKLIGEQEAVLNRDDLMVEETREQLSKTDKNSDPVTEEDVLGFKIVEAEDSSLEFPEFIFPQQVKAKLCQQWENAIIIKLLGRQIGLRALKMRLQKMWAKNGSMQLIDLGCNFFIVKLESQEDLHMVLTGGPWMIYDCYLTVRGWVPNFDPNKASIDIVAAWLRIPDFPMEYYSEKILMFMGNRFGKTVQVDMNTCEKARGGYARLCVNLDLSKPVLSGFKLDGRNFRIEYEGLHLLCRHCGRFGHLGDYCPKNNAQGQVRESSEKQNEQSEKITVENEPGQWTVVQRTRRSRKLIDKASENVA